MQSNPNWGALATQGRVKAVGIPWSDEEFKALRELTTHSNRGFAEIAPYVRDGIMTVEDYEAAVEADKNGKPTSRKSRKELVEEAKALDIPVTDAAPDMVVANEIEKKVKKTTKKK